MDKAVLLLSQYCDNDLSTEDEEEFVDWLKKDSAHVDRFVRSTLLNSLLYDLTQEQNLQSSAWSQALKDSDPYISAQGAKPSLFSRWSSKNTLALAMAATLLGILATFVVVPAMRSPALVAQVTSLHGAAITSNGQAVLVGTLLPSGEVLQVDSGSVLLTFECGAKVYIEGPAKFIVENAVAGSLVEGTLSSRIPTQAIGFAIHTELVDIVDLGTEFQVKLLSNDRLDLHVFDGLVEVHLATQFRHAEDGPLRISEGRSVRFDSAANEIVNLDYDESLKKQF